MTEDMSLKTFIPEIEANAREARSTFGALTPVQLNWKPAPERWSVAQCLEHLIVIERKYWPTFERVASGAFRESRLRRMMFPRWQGETMLRYVEPRQPKKYPTARSAYPSAGEIGADIVERFDAHERELIGHIERMAGRESGDSVIASPVFGLVSYSVRDALRILVAHQRRHFGQARRVMETAGFPEEASASSASAS